MKKEDLHHATNEIFKASESLREALDTLDLCGYEPKGSETLRLDQMQKELEQIAQQFQRLEKEAER